MSFSFLTPLFGVSVLIQNIGRASLALLCVAVQPSSGRAAPVDSPLPDRSLYQQGEEIPGGTASHQSTLSRDSFSHPVTTLTLAQRLDFRLGDALFRKLWVAAPSSTTASDGLGPLFNARSCQSCHVRDGRGHPPVANEQPTALFLRLSIPPAQPQQQQMYSGHLASVPDPVYGSQLQNFSVQNVPAEGKVRIQHEEITVTMTGNEQVVLLKPVYHIEALGYGPMHPQLRLSPRVAPPMLGLGLLEAIPVEQILAREDPEDSNNDGISGRAQLVWSSAEQRLMLGRFGWKAGNATLADQNNSALANDIGIGNPLFPSAYGDCTVAQQACLTAHNGNTPAQENLEAASTMTDLLLFYARHLGVPARQDARNEEVLAGKQQFHQAGCAQCHTPTYTTSTDTMQALAQQTIWPYSDLLLHDMGPGLADEHEEYRAAGHEWRTAPLWGLGHTRRINPKAGYLHDGRARTVLEAILWHGGEAEVARNHVAQRMTPTQRQQLLTFLESL